MQKYYYVKRTNSFQRKRKNPVKVIISFLVVLLLLSGSGIYLYGMKGKSSQKVVLSANSTETHPTPTPTSPPITQAVIQKESSSLGEVIEKELEGTSATYSIVVKNFKTGQTFMLDEDRRYTAASLYKLFVMAKVYQLVREGDLKEDDNVSADIATLNKKFQIASDSAELTEGKISLTIAEALRRMITYSDNYSALLLTQKIKLSTILPYLKENGFLDTNISPKNPTPYTTASDVAFFFEKLYNGDLTNRKYSEKMLDLLKAQKLNKKIPRYLPEDLVIAHKTGELDEYSHDAGIVYSPTGDYIIVLMSKSNQPNLANNRLANIAEAVHKFFIKQ